ncbi:leucine-rich repeat and immunoglobulin-like domain-containing nogo receptor-interacting protein 3 [Chironomus tepperi]|uniref:leucine-rich repeat and immunoglobulin-like domain-containing nogo receptor-interacting protein 3 n=1 Tax=Chironomus tepperi TaxID=113505 RepID=UPI00391EE311
MVFPQLFHLDLEENNLKVIEKDLFKFNPKLSVIRLEVNHIKEIDGNVFDHLEELNVLALDDNECISKSRSERKDVLELIAEIQKSCDPERLTGVVNLNDNSQSLKYIWIWIG